MTTEFQMTAIECIQWMILGINNGNIEASRKLGEDFLKQVEKRKEELQDEKPNA